MKLIPIALALLAGCGPRPIIINCPGQSVGLRPEPAGQLKITTLPKDGCTNDGCNTTCCSGSFCSTTAMACSYTLLPNAYSRTTTESRLK